MSLVGVLQALTGGRKLIFYKSGGSDRNRTDTHKVNLILNQARLPIPPQSHYNNYVLKYNKL